MNFSKWYSRISCTLATLPLSLAHLFHVQTMSEWKIGILGGTIKEVCVDRNVHWSESIVEREGCVNYSSIIIFPTFGGNHFPKQTKIGEHDVMLRETCSVHRFTWVFGSLLWFGRVVPVMFQDLLEFISRSWTSRSTLDFLGRGGGAHLEGLTYFASFSCPARLPL